MKFRSTCSNTIIRQTSIHGPVPSVRKMKYFSATLLVVVQICDVRAMEESCAYIDYIGSDFNITDRGCVQNNVCTKGRVFNISYIVFPPYFYPAMTVEESADDQLIKQRPIEQIMRRCCGTCIQFSDIHIFRNLSEVTLPLIKTSDFVYPFFASSSTDMLYGYHYLPFVGAPQIMYITRKVRPDIRSLLLRVLPVSIICLLMAVVSGFVCWLLETWENRLISFGKKPIKL